jgi:hypothetical protein
MSESNDTSPVNPPDSEAGEISDDLIVERALQIAQSRGREQPSEADWATALARLGVTKRNTIAPELDSPAVEEVTEWDAAPSTSGAKAPEVKPDDESTVEEEFVEEGLDEAERDLRASVDEEDEKS